MSVYDFDAVSIKGEPVSLSQFEGKVLLIVNTASKCGFTLQYKELESLYQKYHEDGLVVLGFPCDQFGHQEPGDNTTIHEFCEINYGVTFPLFGKIQVNGPQAHPLFIYLKEKASGLLGSHSIKWNFTKFLVDSRGHVVCRFAPTTKPFAFEKIVLELLNASS